MKLLVQTDSFAMGGAEKYLIDFFPAFKENFSDVTLLTIDVDKIQPLRNRATHFLLKNKVVSAKYYFKPLEILKIIREVSKADLIYINKINPSKSLVVIFIALLLFKKVYCIEHLNIEIVSKYFFKPPILRKVIKYLMNRINNIITISNVSHDFFIDYYQYPSDKITTIYNGVDLPKNYDVNNNTPIKIILVGRLSLQKNQLNFLTYIN